MSSPTAEFGHGEGTLKRAASIVATAHSDFNQLSTTLDGQIAGVQGQWGGAGAKAFFALHTAWQEKHRTVVGALDSFEGALTSTETHNTSTDEQQGSGFLALAGRLG